MSLQSPEISVGPARRALVNRYAVRRLIERGAVVLAFFLVLTLTGSVFGQDTPPAGEPPAGNPPAPGPGTNEKPVAETPGTTVPRRKPVRRKKPRSLPKKAPRADGIADEFPVYPEKLVPGTRTPENIVLPHLKGGKAPEPPPQRTTTPPSVKKTPAVKRPPKKDDGPGFWASLMNRIRNDQKFINILVLAILVAIFVIYRIRAGGSVRRKF